MKNNGKNQSVVVLAALGVGIVCLLLGLTMWLFGWAGETVAGIFMLIGVVLICGLGFLYSKTAIAQKGVDKTKVKAAREKAMALVGKVAIVLLLALSVILLLAGSLGKTAFMTVTLGFTVMFLLVIAATIYYTSK